MDQPLKSVEFFITPDGKFEYTNPALESIEGYKGHSKRIDEKYDLLRHYNDKKPKAYGSGMAIAGVSPRPAGKTRDGYYSSVFVDYLRSAGRTFAVGSQTFDGVDPSKPLFCHVGFDFPHTPVLPPQDYSCVLWSWRLPNGLSYSDLHTSLKADGFVVYAGQGHLSKEIFRIAHMGDIHNDDLERLEIALRKCIA